MHMHASNSLFGTMNGGLYSGTNGDTLAATVNSFSPIKSSSSSLVDVDISTSPPDLVHQSHHSIHHQIQQHHLQQPPLHIPAKRPAPEVRSTSSLWSVTGTTPLTGYSPTEPTSNGLSGSITTNGNHNNNSGSNNNNNNNNSSSSAYVSNIHESPGSYSSSSPPRTSTAVTSSAITSSANSSSLISPSSMAASAYHHGPSSHYPSLASEIRRPPTAGLVDTKPNVSSSAAAAAAASLNFWQSDYHKYSNPSSCLTPTASDCQASFAAAHQAWNYPHPGQYLTTPEQAAAEARRHMDTSGFHAADYTRLQYPHEGIYTHPPGKDSAV